LGATDDHATGAAEQGRVGAEGVDELLRSGDVSVDLFVLELDGLDADLGGLHGGLGLGAVEVELGRALHQGAVLAGDAAFDGDRAELVEDLDLIDEVEGGFVCLDAALHDGGEAGDFGLDLLLDGGAEFAVLALPLDDVGEGAVVVFEVAAGVLGDLAPRALSGDEEAREGGQGGAAGEAGARDRRDRADDGEHSADKFAVELDPRGLELLLFGLDLGLDCGDAGVDLGDARLSVGELEGGFGELRGDDGLLVGEVTPLGDQALLVGADVAGLEEEVSGVA
jgi:hypothetical protein